MVQEKNLLPDSSVDLCINTDSFQEMTHEQIGDYFNLVQRVVRNNGHFFTRNRVDKIPWGTNSFRFTDSSGPPPNIFAEYPWDDNNEIILHESCKLRQLVGTTNSMIRLEKVIK